jgi:hypothetical protein
LAFEYSYVQPQSPSQWRGTFPSWLHCISVILTDPMSRGTPLAFIYHHSLLFGPSTREFGRPTRRTASLASMTITFLPHVFRTQSPCARQCPPGSPQYVISQSTQALLSDVIGWHMLTGNTCHQSQHFQHQKALIPPRLFQTRTRGASTLLAETRVVTGIRNACQSILFWITTIETRTFTQVPTHRYRQLSPQESTPRQPLHSIKIKGRRERYHMGPRNRRKLPPRGHRGLHAGIGVLVGEITRSRRD